MVFALNAIAASPAEVSRLRKAMILGTLREQRQALRLRLLAASVKPERAEPLIWEAIQMVGDDAWCKAAEPGRLLVRAVDALLEREATLRKHPYRGLLGALGRQWETIERWLSQAGLSGARAEGVVRAVASSFVGSEKTASRLDILLLERVAAACAGRTTDRIILLHEETAQRQQRRLEIGGFLSGLEAIVEQVKREGHK